MKDDEIKNFEEKSNYLESQKVELIQAIAENKAAKSFIKDKFAFHAEWIVIFLNSLTAILSLFLGCPCDTKKPCLYWVLLTIYCALVAVAFGLSLAATIITKRNAKHNEDDIDNRTRANIMSLEMIIEKYKQNTNEIEQQKKSARTMRILAIALSAIAVICAIITVISLRFA